MQVGRRFFWFIVRVRRITRARNDKSIPLSPRSPPGPLLERLEGSLPFQGRLIKKIAVERGVSFGEMIATATHHRRGSFQQLPPIIIGLEAALPPTAKTGNEPR